MVAEKETTSEVQRAVRGLPGSRLTQGPNNTFFGTLGKTRWCQYVCPICGRWADTARSKPPSACNLCRFYRQRRIRYPIRSTSAKERPKCRITIVNQGLTPWPCVEAWDGFSAKTQNGDRTFLSDGLNKQMRKMVGEDHFKQVGHVT